MPPKKAAGSKGGTSGGAPTTVLGDDEMSDVSMLPALNQFIFVNLYAFKYEQNRQNMEKFLFSRLYLAPEGETAEEAKRNKTIQISDLLAHAQAQNYLTEEQATDPSKLDMLKLRQVLARCTNEILASWQITMRRDKQADFEGLMEKMEKTESDEEKKQLRKKLKSKDIELTVWLKDFPRNADDFMEMRRSGQQHQPEIEVAINGLFMIEEQFERTVDEEDAEIQGLSGPDQEATQREETKSELAKRNKKQEEMQAKQDRIQAYQSLLTINKFARNCYETSEMRKLNVEKIKFSGPDPPFVRPEPEPTDEDQQAAVEEKKEVKAKAGGAAGKGKAVEEVPVEVELTPEEQAEEEMFNRFMDGYMLAVEKAKGDLTDYRKLLDPEDGVKKVALWPSTKTAKQIEQEILKKEEAKMKKDEEEEAARQAAEEQSSQAAGTNSKKTSKQASGKEATRNTASRGGTSTAQSARDSMKSRQKDIQMQIRKEGLKSQDDRAQDWNFEEFRRVMADMESASTDVGGILSAIIYQIEQHNKDDLVGGQGQNGDGLFPTEGGEVVMKDYAADQAAHKNNANGAGLHSHKNSQQVENSVDRGNASHLTGGGNGAHGESSLAEPTQEEKQRETLMGALDTMMQKLTVEHAVITTDFAHKFEDNKNDGDGQTGAKKNESQMQSPYQDLMNTKDRITQNDEAFQFDNGLRVGDYERHTQEKMQLPGINNRIDMPEKATRQVAERQSDMATILRNCPLPTHRTIRLLRLQAFEKLLERENPERTYDFKGRNFEEKMDAKAFRQVLVDYLKLCPDVNTAYYDREDALLLALNFKNPPGRILRRQWTAQPRCLPDFAQWRSFVKEQNVEIQQPTLDIPSNKLGLVRSNQKFCFPCDNSVIRIDKHFVGSRRFGASVICKDNFIFGLRETVHKVQEKVFGEDEFSPMELRKVQERDCEFWLEFENQVKLSISMQKEVEPDLKLIPPVNNEFQALGLTQMQPTISESQSQADIDQKEGAAATQDDRDGLDVARSAVGSQESLRSKGDKKSSLRKTGQKSTGEDSDGKVKDSIKETSIGALEINTKAAPAIRVNDVVSPSLNSPTSPGKRAMKQTIQMDENYKQNEGSMMTFTFQEGLVVQVLPNGNVRQKIVKNSKIAKKQSVIQLEGGNEEQEETSREVTRQGEVIKQLSDGNQVIYFQDGTITSTDHRKGIWKTINPHGVVRERNVRNQTVKDDMERLKTTEKIDPETNASVSVREDGLLTIQYADRRTLLIMPDHTEILITKSGPQEEGSALRTTLFKKDGYSPVRITSDPVKARAATIIGLGGTDALMGKDSIMERSYGGLLSETFLPDKSIVQTYLEKQELPGYNQSSTSLIHMVRRADKSVLKVRQDGEVVLISAIQRYMLNENGKQNEFGVNDYDFFFELFGVANERGSGVFTANLDAGRLWTQDEEGNYFIIYANGDSTEKLSVSFNLDQMVEGIENKEPTSPRIPDGEYIEDECKFLPPPKSVAHPRLFLVTKDGATEYSDREQLEYLFMSSNQKGADGMQSNEQIDIDNEKALSHFYMKKLEPFDASNPATLDQNTMPKMPQCLEIVNQTVSIKKEPEKVAYTWRNIWEYEDMSEKEVQQFQHACEKRDNLRSKQSETKEELTIQHPQVDDDTFKNQCKIMLKIAKKRGINVQELIGDEYKQIKQDDRDKRREEILNSLDEYFSAPATQNTVTMDIPQM